jgi:peptide/nickel transport system permease protein
MAVVLPEETVVPIAAAPRRARGGVPFSLVAGALIVGTFVVMAVAPGVFSSRSTTNLDVANQFLPPSSAHWLGTDEVGRDLFTRVVHGARYSLTMAVLVVLISAVIGTLIGMIAGYAGGWVDQLIMRLTDVFFSLPTFVLAMAIAVVMGRGMASLVFALCLVWWPSHARMVRGMVLSLKERPHVQAARALGAHRRRLVVKHILPFLAGALNVRITQDIGYALVAVASLSFIGLGAQPPTPEWGLVLSGARTYITGSWWYPVFPGVAIVLATLGFSLLGDGIAGLKGRN